MQQTFAAEILKTQLEVQEQTMQTIGADLHDNIGQLLSLTSLTLNSIEISEVNKARQKIDTALDLNSRCIKELRLLGKLLQGEQLIKNGLTEAISNEITWIEKAGQYQVDYQTENFSTESNVDKDLLVFRILQEVLNNIVKHAFATQINIKLCCRDKQLQLIVEDNGVGFLTDEVPQKQHGMGLHNIRKRAELMGGEVGIRSEPGTGTLVELNIPYP
ncbi:MAG: sensor histidine kinase [Mucilaginibacter sp.]|uniref:sensor histidine kinase n=1 Tax=Mucilaginibacter sp. TaxID=1882438 RepID=UPI0034E45DD1